MLPHERVIHAYVHQGRIGVLVELGADSDFALRTSGFAVFAHDVAMHIAALEPASVLDLLEQPFVKDNSLTVGELLARLATALRERVAIIRFVRWDTCGPPPGPEPPRAPAVARRA
jgi:elongation factor Ts